MAKRNLYPLFAAEDKEKLQPLLDSLKEKGFRIIDRADALAQGDTVLFFLSEHLTESSGEVDDFLRFDAQKADIIPVSLDGTKPPALIENAILARNTIHADRYTTEELAERIAGAPEKPDSSASKWRNWFLAAAVVLLAAAGILLFRACRNQTPVTVTAEESPAPTAVPVFPGDIPPEDTDRILEIVFVGDTYRWYTAEDYDDPDERKGAGAFAYRYQDETGAHWASKDDGHEFHLTHYDSLDWIAALPNLKYLTLAATDGDVPNLVKLSHLESVTVSDTTLTDFSFLAGSPVYELDYAGDRVTRFSALNSCESLSRINLDLMDAGTPDFSDFAPPAVTELILSNYPGAGPVDLSALKGKTPLMKRLRLYRLTPADLSFTDGMDQLESLELYYMRLKRLDGIENLKNLKTLILRDVSDLADISAVEGCVSLEEFAMTGYPENVTVSDLSALGKLPKLYYLSNVAAQNTDLDFLKELPTKRNITFILVNLAVTDHSGFSAIESYDFIYLNMETNQSGYSDAEPALRYLQESSIDALYLRNAVHTDLSMVSHVNTELDLETCDIRDFTTLSDDASFIALAVYDCRYLRSLDGIERIKGFGTITEGTAKGELYLENCPHLTDWSALSGLRLKNLYLVGMDTLPDFSTFSADTYYLTGIPNLTDLSCFAGLDPEYVYSFDLSGQDGLTDISALYKLKGGHLCVRPEWKEQAEELVASGRFESYEVKYPDAPWQPDDSEITLLSLDELETLPNTVLARVRELCVAGDTVFDGSEYWIEEDQSTNPPTLYLRKNGSQEDSCIPVKAGTYLTDLSVLKNLTNLRSLRLYMQPMETLDGIQYLRSLEELTVQDCGALSDVSAAFTLQRLTSLDLRLNENVTSIAGIQNLLSLKRLDLDGYRIGDLSPLEAFGEDVSINTNMQ